MAEKAAMANISLVLGIGASGPSVLRAQQLLKARGFISHDEPGLFGPSTEDAVRQLQMKLGLRVDGTVSAEVWRVLERDEAKEAAAAAAMAAARQQAQPMSAKAPPAPTQAEVTAVAQQMAAAGQPAPSGGFPWGKVLLFGGIAAVAYAALTSAPSASAFDTYEDDYGLDPVPPGDFDADDASASGSVPSLGGADTGIVPFGGGAPLKRGPGGRFLPRGKKILTGS